MIIETFLTAIKDNVSHLTVMLENSEYTLRILSSNFQILIWFIAVR